MKRIYNLVLTLVAALVSGCAGVPFHPAREVDKTPAEVNLPYEDVRITTADGERIAGWFIPASASGTDGVSSRQRVLLFFHGNAGNISHRLSSLLIFHELGLAQLIIDYRGFGESSGSPSVNGTKLDARAAWEWLLREKGYSPEQVIIFGRSLGGGVAASLAAETEPAGLIMESTFISLKEVAKHMFPMMPVGLLLPQDYDTVANLEKMHIPVLFIHSPDDEVVPFAQGKALYDNYKGPGRFLQITGAHNNGFWESYPQYTQGLSDLLRSIAGSD